MQLSSISISNILSFSYIDEKSSYKGTDFASGEGGVVNILIGPNGSGKSNFLEIINQVFSIGLFKEYKLNRSSILSTKTTNKNVISEKQKFIRNLKPHIHSKDKPSEIKFILKLSESDKDNIKFLCKYWKEINTIIEEYSNLPTRFFPPAYDSINWLIYEKIGVHCEVDFSQNKIFINKDNQDQLIEFLYNYLEHFDLIQKCMDIWNHQQKVNQNSGTAKKQWYTLKNTFAILGSYRNYNHLSGKFSLIEYGALNLEDIDDQEDTKSHANEPVGLSFTKKKLVSKYDQLSKTYKPLSYSEIIQSDLYIKINSIINEILNLNLGFFIDDSNPEKILFELYFVDHLKQRLELDDLSSGEKSMLMTIFTLFGYDLEHGLMIIDEPELHLHPQLQKTFMRVLNGFAKEFDMQFLIATHSSLMVNESNINYVYRFYRKHDFTHIVSPKNTNIANEAGLVQMLKFTHTSKIFFVDTILLVEGETDEYFFNYFLNYLSTDPTWKERIKSYEIININGKGSHKMRRRFLEKFGLKAIYIGDWDNVIDEFPGVDFLEVRQQLKRHRHEHNEYRMRKTEKYKRLVEGIREYYPDLYNKIGVKIEQLQNNGIFILKQGDIESYLGLEEKGLTFMVDFCRHYFKSRLQNPKYISKRMEFLEMFDEIFPLSSQD